MDRLRCLQVFSEVARCGSFLRAATSLSLSPSTITKHIAWLEASMGAQLLKRTSKQVALTEAGARVLASGRDLLERYDAIESGVRDAVHLPRGAIRVGTPPSFGAYHLMRLMAEFTRRYPDIEVTMVHDDGRSDLVAEALGGAPAAQVAAGGRGRALLSARTWPPRHGGRPGAAQLPSAHRQIERRRVAVRGRRTAGHPRARHRALQPRRRAQASGAAGHRHLGAPLLHGVRRTPRRHARSPAARLRARGDVDQRGVLDAPQHAGSGAAPAGVPQGVVAQSAGVGAASRDMTAITAVGKSEISRLTELEPNGPTHACRSRTGN